MTSDSVRTYVASPILFFSLPIPLPYDLTFSLPLQLNHHPRINFNFSFVLPLPLLGSRSVSRRLSPGGAVFGGGRVLWWGGVRLYEGCDARWANNSRAYPLWPPLCLGRSALSETKRRPRALSILWLISIVALKYMVISLSCLDSAFGQSVCLSVCVSRHVRGFLSDLDFHYSLLCFTTPFTFLLFFETIVAL